MFLCLSFVYTVFLHDSLLIHCSLSPVTSSSFLLFLPSSRLLHLLCIQNTYSSECVWQENQKESCSLTVWDNRPVNHHYLCLCSYVFSSQSQRITPVSRFTNQWVALSLLFLFIPRNDLVLSCICICLCVNLLYELSFQMSWYRTSSASFVIQNLFYFSCSVMKRRCIPLTPKASSCLHFILFLKRMKTRMMIMLMWSTWRSSRRKMIIFSRESSCSSSVHLFLFFLPF